MAETHTATVTITTSGPDSDVTPNPLKVNPGDTVLWEPVGGTIDSFSFGDNKVFSKKPKQLKNLQSWEAEIDKNSKAVDDKYTVYVTADSGEKFGVDPELQVGQG